ncbi:MAG: 2-hydroxychromene-2-carboxylate isomerase [Myxococcota bacterium]
MPTLEFWFDYACPWAYLASTRVEALAERIGARLSWRPMLLGGVFRAVGTPQNLATTLSPQKARNELVDRARWASLLGVPLDAPPEHPRRTVEALRATLARGCDPAVIHAFFRAYWSERRAIEDPAVVRAIAGDVDLDAQREPLRAATDEAIAKGVFGAPALILDGELYWGLDRMTLLEPPAPAPTATGRHTVEFFFDFSSPYAYLASTQVDRLDAEVTWRPMLLGAVFQAVGTHDVPLFSFSEPKRRHAIADFSRWASRWGADFTFASRFPLRTVTPLRAFLAHPDPVPFAHRVFRAAWVEDRDVADRAVLADLGASPEVLAADRKQALFDATAYALGHGVFGAPAFLVDGKWLFWGQDRLQLVERVLAGWVPPA